jgi:uncharacterized protein (DUF1015 family)
MARIRPFNGLRYRLSNRDASALLAPPYDVVDAEGRAEIGSRSPDNCIHVILPQGEGDAKYAEGARQFERIGADALERDEQPSFYVYHQRFEFEGVEYLRRGFVCLIELTRFGQGPVLPHERTLSGPKADRLALMRACDAHLELVFGLFSDPDKKWEGIVAPALGEASLDCEFDGFRHELFAVRDPEVCAALSAYLEDAKVYIADGHHRYETMCAFGEELAAAGRGEGAARWGMIYLSNLDDEGLVVRPTHRIVHSLPSFGEVEMKAALETAAAFFDIQEYSLAEHGSVSGISNLLAESGKQRAAFALAPAGQKTFYGLALKADFDPEAAGLGDLNPALQTLDVALLHELVLERALGISKEAQANKTNLLYFKSYDDALARARDGADGAQLICFMNPTPVADVVAVCDSGQVMPQKSTFFHPKIPTGLVFHDLSREG